MKDPIRTIEKDDETLYALYRLSRMRLMRHFEIDYNGQEELSFYEIWQQILSQFCYYITFNNIGIHWIEGMNKEHWENIENWLNQTNDIAMASKERYCKKRTEFGRLSATSLRSDCLFAI